MSTDELKAVLIAALEQRPGYEIELAKALTAVQRGDFNGR